MCGYGIHQSGWSGRVLHGNTYPLVCHGYTRCPRHRAVLSKNLQCCTDTQHLQISTVPFSKEFHTLTDMSSCIPSFSLRQGGDQHAHLCFKHVGDRQKSGEKLSGNSVLWPSTPPGLPLLPLPWVKSIKEMSIVFWGLLHYHHECPVKSNKTTKKVVLIIASGHHLLPGSYFND